ncbi:uncharacterized protein [Elaeis guineensis]|uniref:Transport and Golgi organization 2 homolog n=1 Tax=Elaeis guineensis var. tenera TaxID=51953 RepID=A0A6I9R203_ELAGV|nr:transport and Golgi organization 2 homolog [Elaeis guineensis]
MCIAAWIWQAHPVYRLQLLFNRDEYYSRPTNPVGWWGDGHQKILGGRDELGGGTWLGCTKNGRLAFLTFVLEPDPLPGCRTRGELPLRFLKSTKSPLEFAEEIVREANQYNGFNLISADLCSETMVYISNRPKDKPPSIQVVSPGLHVLSNADLDSPWPKAQRLAGNFSELLKRHGEEEIPEKEMVEELMRDTVRADKDKLPNTGCDSEWEFGLSSIFVDLDTKLGQCGTRSMAAVSVKTNGEVNFYEKYLENNLWNEHILRYWIEKLS